MNGKQNRLDLISISIFILSLYVFQETLNVYLSGLSNPLPFKFILMFSIGLAFFYEIKDGINRRALLRCVATMVVFSIAVYFAIGFREFYLGIISELREFKEFDEKVGFEYVSALENKAVGIGACYFACVAIFRIISFKLIYTLICKWLLDDNKEPRCEKCGQEIHGN